MADDSHDVVVVGAGVIGLACSFRLAREGRQVLLIDREQPGMGTSFGNAGHIATEQVFPLASPEVVRGVLRYLLNSESPLRIRPGYLLSILPWLLRFAWSSRRSAFDRGVRALCALQKTVRADWTSLLDQAGASRLMHMDGHLVLVENPESVPAAQSEITRLAPFGIAAEWLSPAEVSAIAPDITTHIAGAQKYTGTGHVDDPYAVSKALFDAFIVAGGKFLQSEATRIERTAERFTVRTADGGRHSSSHLVLCCGAFSKPLAAQLGFSVPLDTERGYHITLPEVFPRFRIPVASYERKVIMTPMSAGLRMTGTVEFGGLKLPPDPRRFALLKRHLNVLVPSISTDDMTCWMGFRPSLPDHLPVLGRAPDRTNLYFAFGHQHLGLTLAGVTSRIIALQVTGRDPEIDLAPFAPDRF